MSSGAVGQQAIVLCVSDFSMTPGGRYKSEGDFSGELFREGTLQPHLDKGLRVIVDLDGPEGFPSSFLEEVFGGIVRHYRGVGGKKRLAEVLANLEIRSPRNPWRVEKARGMIDRAIHAVTK